MDDAEHAIKHEELSRQIALGKRYPTLAPVGRCHYCSEQVKGAVLFCDSECLLEHESEMEIRVRQYACPACGD